MTLVSFTLALAGDKRAVSEGTLMATLNGRALALLTGALFATSACGANTTVPTGAMQVAAPDAGIAKPAAVDMTSILKKLKKDVKIGSTIDPKNGDMGPRAISLVRGTFKLLKKGQLLVCNFEDSKGTAGNGSTIEILDPTPNSKPKTFTQNSKIEGCDGNAITENLSVYGSGMTAGDTAEFDDSGNEQQSYGSPLVAPLADADADCGLAYAPENIYIGDGHTGGLVKLGFLPVTQGRATETQVVSGFAANKGSGWSALGPSGIQYNSTRSKTGQLCNDTLYVVDGVDNTIVAISTASQLLSKNEIVVEKGGKTFKCAHKSKTCATVVYSGSPLNAPVASALLPNGNLIVANTKGGNTLVEVTSSGKVLATKTIDSSSTAHIFGLLATGTDDSNTVLYYTDTGTNTLQELEQ